MADQMQGAIDGKFKRKSGIYDSKQNQPKRGKIQKPVSVDSSIKEQTSWSPSTRSPFSNISNIVGTSNLGNGCNNQHTLPSCSALNLIVRKRRTIQNDRNGINLMTKYLNFDDPSQQSTQTNQSGGRGSSQVTHEIDEDEDQQNCEGFNSDSELEDVVELPHEYPFASPNYQDVGYSDIGEPVIECDYCHALMFYQERMRKNRHSATPKYQLCCGNGKVQVPLFKDPPQFLKELLFTNETQTSKNFQQNIRLYNMMFAFTSPGAKLDKSLNNGRGPPMIRIQGQPVHRIGSLLPMTGRAPLFAQLYIYDTENEVLNRCTSFKNTKCIYHKIVENLKAMLDTDNKHAQCFRMARDRLRDGNVQELKLKLISNRSSDGRVYNLPTVAEIAALIVGDVDSAEARDIIIEERSGKLQRIIELQIAIKLPTRCVLQGGKTREKEK